MDQAITTIIEQYLKEKEEKYFVLLLERFHPLVRKYAKKLYYLEYDDSIQELNLAIYEALQKMSYVDNEFACISYIRKAIYHKFCKLYASSEQEQQKLEQQTQYEDLLCSDKSESIQDCTFLHDLRKMLDTLCYPKKQIIYLLLQGYSDKEIGEKLHCSRQYINRVKKSILDASGLAVVK